MEIILILTTTQHTGVWDQFKRLFKAFPFTQYIG